MKPLVVLAAAALAAGCASSGINPATQTVRTSTNVSSTGRATQTIESYQDMGGTTVQVSAAPDRVWEVLPAVYQSLGIAVGTTLPDAKTLGNIKLELNRTLGGQPLSAFLNCGEGVTGTAVADNYRVNMSVLTMLSASPGGGTRVETRVNGSAMNRAVSGGAVNCATTGRLESLIAERIRSRN